MRSLRNIKGFNLLDTAITIGVVGVLGVTAVGSFKDISSNAGTAAVNALVADIQDAAKVNYYVCQGDVAGNAGTISGCVNASTCATLNTLYINGGFPTTVVLSDGVSVGLCNISYTASSGVVYSSADFGVAGVSAAS